MRHLFVITTIATLFAINAIDSAALSEIDQYSDSSAEAFIDSKSIKEMIRESIGLAATIVAALFFLIFYIQNRADKALLCISTLCLSAAALHIANGNLTDILISTDATWLDVFKGKLIYAALIWTCTAILMFHHYSYPMIADKKLTAISCSLTLFGSSILAFNAVELSPGLASGFIGYGVLLLLVSLWILTQAYRRNQHYSTARLITFLIFIMAIVIGLATGNQVAEISLYALAGLIIIENCIFSKKFFNANLLADKLSSNLKEEVLQQTAALNKKNQQLEQTQQALTSAIGSLKRLSITDGLTQLYNRRYFDREFGKEWRRACRYQSHLSVLMIDIDYFKKLNDSAGHIAGDQGLLWIAQLLKRHFKRAGELTARYGGEEFAVVLPNTKSHVALSIAESLRHAVEQQHFIYNEKLYHLTISIGVCTAIPTTHCSELDVLLAADSALYKAKHNGRNRVATVPLLPACNSKVQ